MEIVILLSALLVLIGLSAMYSGAETAITKLSNARVEVLVKNDEPGARALRKLKQNPRRTIITILFGNNLVNIGASSMAAGAAISAFGSLGVGIATGVMTFLILTFGEVTPKSIALSRSEKFALRTAVPVLVTMYVFYPFIVVFERMVGKMIRGEDAELTEDELEMMISIGAEEGAIEKHEKQMIHSIFRLDDITAEDIMIPKNQVVMTEAKTSLKDLLKLFSDTGFTRIPVYREIPENVIGIAHLKKAMRANRKARAGEIADPPLFVPEGITLDRLLREFQDKRMHMAIVLDEYGNYRGIVTLEDVLEEVFGEIYDETEKVESSIRRTGKNTAIVRGDANLEEVNEKLGLDLKSEEYETLGGFLLEKFGTIPKKGEKYSENGLTFLVKDADKRHIKKVRISGLKKASKKRD